MSDDKNAIEDMRQEAEKYSTSGSLLDYVPDQEWRDVGHVEWHTTDDDPYYNVKIPKSRLGFGRNELYTRMVTHDLQPPEWIPDGWPIATFYKMWYFLYNHPSTRWIVYREMYFNQFTIYIPLNLTKILYNWFLERFPALERIKKVKEDQRTTTDEGMTNDR